ncbi:MAG: hypothetical protein IT180_17490 [Acidobacteria bacterium]|nr:hypothetical protein [Acidobacteriota bacterium]HQZ40162.1 hypothetical protein [Vicinamibacterales bacterium]
MSRETRARADLYGMAGYAASDQSTCAPTRVGTGVHNEAVQRMRQGHRLVISGFVVAVAGVVAYCVVCLGAALNQNLGAALLESPGWLAGSMLGIIGLGTLLWLVGSFMYLSGGMDSDPDDADLYS